MMKRIKSTTNEYGTKVKSYGMKMKSSIRRPAAAAVVFAAMLALAASLSAFAGSSLLTPGTSRITAGSTFDFKLNLGSVADDDSGDEAGVDETEFTVALEISPDISALTVKEDKGHINVVSGKYEVTSEELDGITELHFVVTPATDITAETTYTVSVAVRGDVKGDDSFQFIVVPVETPDTPDTPDVPDNKDKKADLPSKKISMKKASGISGASTTASNLVYAGSWDNYLDDLSVDGYEFTRKFNKIRDTYFLVLPDDVTSVSVSATASDSSAIVAVAGNSDIAEDGGKIMVSVTADDGSVRVYRIYITREKDVVEEEESETESGSFPEGFDPENMPEGFDPENMPEGFEPGNMPDGFTPGGSNSGGSGDTSSASGSSFSDASGKSSSKSNSKSSKSSSKNGGQ